MRLAVDWKLLRQRYPEQHENARPGWPRMPEREDELGEIERMCRVCGDWWPLVQFVAAKDCRRGRSSECKACRNERRNQDVALRRAVA